MDRHRILFKYDSTKGDLAIQLAFNSALSDDRKDWIRALRIGSQNQLPKQRLS